MLELLIRGGDVVTPEGVATCDIAVAGERIAAIAAPGALPAQSARRKKCRRGSVNTDSDPRGGEFVPFSRVFITRIAYPMTDRSCR